MERAVGSILLLSGLQLKGHGRCGTGDDLYGPFVNSETWLLIKGAKARPLAATAS